MIDAAIRFLERHPSLPALPTPQWVSSALAAHQRRRRLVLDIAMLAGPDVAFVALWLARWHGISSVGGTVDGALQLFRANLAR